MSIIRGLYGAVSGGGSGTGWAISIQTFVSSAPSATLGNLVPYIPLRNATEDYALFTFQAPSTGTVGIQISYMMSAANGGDVELRLDRSIISAGDDPAAAGTLGTEFVVTPGNDALAHVVDETTHSSFELTVTAGDLVACAIQRTNDAADTHTADFRILGVMVVPT